MPVIENTAYSAPLLLGNPHIQTVFPTLFRKVQALPSEMERIETPDGDFLELAVSAQGSNRAVLLSHGLEGSADAIYMRGMARFLYGQGYDVIRWNLRGCGAEPNLKPFSYHSGASHDLRTVIAHILSRFQYASLGLVGFSVGGNLTLKYLGEEAAGLDARIKGAVCISVPCDLRSSSERLAEPQNKIYMLRFLRLLRSRLEKKAILFPGEISLTGFSDLKTFLDYDTRYTAPLNGFKDAYDYWQQSSSVNFLSSIHAPTLILNAKDDHFLGAKSYPFEAAALNASLFLEVPAQGGHVGFIKFIAGGAYWSELRALEFLAPKLTD